MTKAENLRLSLTISKVKYFQKRNFEKYVIIDYIDRVINQVRNSESYSNELLRHLFDIRQKALLCKEM